MLASSLDYETTLANVAQLVVPQFADWCAVDVVERGRHDRRLAVVHRIPTRPSGPAARADFTRRTGRARGNRPRRPHAASRCSTGGSRTTCSRRPPESRRTSRCCRELGMASAMVVPMKARGRTLGALMLVSSDPARLYDDDALDLRGAPRAAGRDGGRQRAALQPFRAARSGGARARRSSRDGVMLVDEDGDRADLERRRRDDHRPAGARRRQPAGRGGRSRAGPASKTHVPLATGPGTPRAETVPLEFERRRALAVDLRRLLPRRHGLRVPRPDRGAARRAPEERVRLDDLARAPDAARGDLRRRADAPAPGAARSRRSGMACSTSSPPRPSGSRGSSTTSSG